jgi:hypothetical protein
VCFSLPLFFTWHFEKLGSMTHKRTSFLLRTTKPTSGVVVMVVGTHTATHTQTVGRACAKELLHVLYIIPLKEEAPPAAGAPYMAHNT